MLSGKTWSANNEARKTKSPAAMGVQRGWMSALCHKQTFEQPLVMIGPSRFKTAAKEI
jgi:hypothetical protein